ncbi:MAG: hypothetical protein CL908_09115 [Deltaproteobacteria bacterium]|nr:hypothetical protein [Deltaproteobacteria bacterium]
MRTAPTWRAIAARGVVIRVAMASILLSSRSKTSRLLIAHTPRPLGQAARHRNRPDPRRCPLGRSDERRSTPDRRLMGPTGVRIGILAAGTSEGSRF